MLSTARSAILVLLALALPTLASGLAVPAAPAEAEAAVLRVDVFDFGYRDAASGTPVTNAKVGDTIRFVVTSGIHTVTGGVAARGIGGGPDSGTLPRGASFDFVVGSSGVIAYTCEFHPTMNGVIVAQ